MIADLVSSNFDRVILVMLESCFRSGKRENVRVVFKSVPYLLADEYLLHSDIK